MSPISAPTQTMSQPAARSAFGTPSLIRSTRKRHLKGVTRPGARPRRAKRSIQFGLRPKMSSANQMWSGAKVSLSHFSSCGHVFRAAHVVALAVDGLGAPVAVVRAAARRYHVHRIVAVALVPDRLVARQYPPDPRPGTGRSSSSRMKSRLAMVGRFGPGRPRPRSRWVVRLPCRQAVEQFAQRDFALADDDARPPRPRNTALAGRWRPSRK